MSMDFPVLAGLLARSLKKRDFWADRGFELELGDTTETCAEVASDAEVDTA